MSPIRGRAHRVAVADRRDTLESSDYASAFEATVEAGDQRSPEQWVRSCFEDAPPAMRAFVLLGWRYVLGLRLGPRPSPSYVLGWEIVTASEDTILLEVSSGLATARKVLRIETGRVVMTTSLRFDRQRGRAIWTVVAPIHHRTEPYLLGHAATSS